MNAGGDGALLKNASERIFQMFHLQNTLGNLINSALVEHQSVEHCFAHAVFFCFGKIKRVGGDDGFRIFHKPVGEIP